MKSYIEYENAKKCFIQELADINNWTQQDISKVEAFSRHLDLIDLSSCMNILRSIPFPRWSEYGFYPLVSLDPWPVICGLEKSVYTSQYLARFDSLREERKVKKVTQPQLAEIMTLAQQNFPRIESHSKTLDLTNLLSWLDDLECELTSFLQDIGRIQERPLPNIPRLSNPSNQ